MKKLLLAIAVLCLAGCSITDEAYFRNPEFGVTSTAGIGDPIYRYRKQGKVFHDYMNAKESNMTDSKQFEILYSGLSKGELKVTYREFINDLARSSFYQEASYDYSGGKTMITFKGAKVEVLNANNQQIQYRVLNGFSGEEFAKKE